MTRIHPKLLTLVLPALVLASITSAQAADFSGKINGHGCAHAGMTCPVDRLDPHIALEPDFVLQQPDGDYLFLVNVPRSTKLRYVLEDVKVTGDLNKKYNSVTVDEFMVQRDGRYKTIWSQKAQEAEWENLHGGGTWFSHQ